MADKQKPKYSRPKRKQTPKKGTPDSSSEFDEVDEKTTDDDSKFESIKITTHRQLLTQQKAIFQRFNDNPELTSLLLINPVLAFKEVGVDMSREIAHHILHTRQHPPRMRQRRDELEAKLQKKLGELPKPNDPAWVSNFLFTTLKIAPLSTRGHKPVYTPQLSEEVVERLQKLRPKRHKRRQRAKPTMIIRVQTARPVVQRLNLDAKLPKLEQRKTAPETISLETLYFYKDSHPTVRDLLELGIIQQRSFPVHSGDSYRKIKDGTKKNAFRTWIKSIRFSGKRT